MPFLLYDVSVDPSGRKYRYAGTVRIAGNNGPLAQIQRTRNTAAVCPFPWHATCAEIVAAIPGTVPGQEIVIDLKPTVADNVSLYRVRDIWGFSDKDWTPLALLLECLFVDLNHPKPMEFKTAFKVSPAPTSLVGEFLYVQGGVLGGTWNWGRVGRVNGTLLWPEPFAYLTSELGRVLRR